MDFKYQNKTLIDDLPQSFKNFLKVNNIDPEKFYSVDLINNLPRYIRINPHLRITIDELSKQLGNITITPISWLKDVYMIPSNIKINNTKAYQNGQIYGIDLSSCCVVMSLNPQTHEHILDMCCSPGAKLCYIADLMKDKENIINGGSLTGVDISLHRMNTCRSLLRKYMHKDCVKTYIADGTEFNLLTGSENNVLYDKILVDAECTHDGSVKHLMKFNRQSSNVKGNNEKLPEVNEESKNELAFEIKNHDHNDIIKSNNIEDISLLKKEESKQNKVKMSNKQKKRLEKQKLEHENFIKNKKLKVNEWSIQDFEERVMNKEKIDNIVSLQKKLCLNCFKLLKIDGHLVYSTCSFTKAQNEDLIEFLLNECKETIGKLELIDPFDDVILKNVEFKEGSIKKTVRFDPFSTNSGGMFIAKMRKICN